jgi:transcriptional regulator with XRE-family HTH domain
MDLAVNERLRDFLKSRKIKLEEFRKKMNVRSLQQISNWMTLKEKIPDKYLRQTVIEYKEINARWLLTGDGKMMNEDFESASENHHTEKEYDQVEASRDNYKEDVKDLNILVEDIEQCIKVLTRASKILKVNIVGNMGYFHNQKNKTECLNLQNIQNTLQRVKTVDKGLK